MVRFLRVSRGIRPLARSADSVKTERSQSNPSASAVLFRGFGGRIGEKTQKFREVSRIIHKLGLYLGENL